VREASHCGSKQQWRSLCYCLVPARHIWVHSSRTFHSWWIANRHATSEVATTPLPLLTCQCGNARGSCTSGWKRPGSRGWQRTCMPAPLLRLHKKGSDSRDTHRTVWSSCFLNDAQSLGRSAKVSCCIKVNSSEVPTLSYFHALTDRVYAGALCNGHLQAMSVPWQKPREQGKDRAKLTSPVAQKPLERSFGRVGKRDGSSHSFLHSRPKSFRVRDQESDRFSW